jgi:threonylcarbamoyladenosine tRNA methylthiotransferase MtaB
MKELAAAAGLDGAVIVNTCAVTAEAVRKAKQEIRRLSRENPGAAIIVTGCAAQTEPETFAAMPEVTRVVGNHEKMQAETWRGIAAPDLIGADRAGAGRRHHVGARNRRAPDRRVRAAPGLCPGPERLRPPLHLLHHPLRPRQLAVGPGGVVVEQINRLVDKGFNEVVLTGVDLTSWGADLPGTPKLGDLVRAS